MCAGQSAWSPRGSSRYGIEAGPQGLRLGAAATMAEVAAHPRWSSIFPLISEALLNSASPQVRNQATMGGNLLQRTRCPYFRDVGYEACKSARQARAAPRRGENRWHAVLGTSDNCIAAHPSDLAVALWSRSMRRSRFVSPAGKVVVLACGLPSPARGHPAY